MRVFASLLAVLAASLLTAGCGDYANSARGDVDTPINTAPNPNNLPNANTVPKPGGGSGYVVSLSPVVIDEVLLDPQGVDDGKQFVELYNATAWSADIGGWVLTDGASTFTFPFGFQIDSGARVIVHLGASGVGGAAEQYAPSFALLDKQAGSLALLRGGSELVDFVQWGDSPNPMEGAAATAGEWPAGDFAAVAPEGDSLNYDGTANDSTAWTPDATSPGQ